MSKLWLDDDQVTFLLLLWKYILISPYEHSLSLLSLSPFFLFSLSCLSNFLSSLFLSLLSFQFFIFSISLLSLPLSLFLSLFSLSLFTFSLVFFLWFWFLSSPPFLSPSLAVYVFHLISLCFLFFFSLYLYLSLSFFPHYSQDFMAILSQF